MTAHTPLERSFTDARAEAIDEVNRWRGHCVEIYARVEYEITRTLSAMAVMQDAQTSIPHNFGEKVKKLRTAVEPAAPLANSKLAIALKDFADHFDRRNMLVHSTGKVWVGVNGDWLWRYRFQPSGKGRPMEVGCFARDDALDIEKALALAGRSLGNQLRSLRNELATDTN